LVFLNDLHLDPNYSEGLEKKTDAAKEKGLYTIKSSL